MRHILLVIRNGAFAAAIAVALAFSAMQALSGTPDAARLQNPCIGYCEDSGDCVEVCGPPWLGGTCKVSQNCCVCFER